VDEIDLSDEWESHAATVVPAPAPAVPPLQVHIAASEQAPEIKLDSAAAELGIAPFAPVPAAPVGEHAPVASAAVEVPALVPEPAPSPTAAQEVLNDLVAELEESLGNGFTEAHSEAPAAVAVTPPAVATVTAAVPPRAVAQQPTAAAASQPAAEDEATSALSEIFAEFKEEAEAGTEQLEDPETHYNLGVAFREMGLMDEAIGELQKVCAAIDRGATFPHVMQTYTWLAQCFVDKGVPEASYKWYERALKVSTDDQQRMSLHYDLAAAYEAAGNRAAALQHFLEVYGTNIDYRDVAERIKALRS
jgi:tetratricopeptide (TPR) repeat protein